MIAFNLIVQCNKLNGVNRKLLQIVWADYYLISTCTTDYAKKSLLHWLHIWRALIEKTDRNLQIKTNHDTRRDYVRLKKKAAGIANRYWYHLFCGFFSISSTSNAAREEKQRNISSVCKQHGNIDKRNGMTITESNEKAQRRQRKTKSKEIGKKQQQLMH